MSAQEVEGPGLPEELLRSPLRLRLLEELVSPLAPQPGGLQTEDLGRLTAALNEDVAGCLEPLQALGWVVRSSAGEWSVPAERQGATVAALGEQGGQVSALASRMRRVQRGPLASIIGSSPRMKLVFEQILMAARARVSVLVMGETGTGKELVARAIHQLSAQEEGPFVGVNSSALPMGLFESELFGHVRGAFTGARSDRRGRMLEASGGTLFLDEIGELDPAGQSKLLRSLQERTVLPLGADKEVETDFRLICATNRDLAVEAQAGRFREDLLYRINVFTITLPALRERPSDIPALARFFLATAAQRGLRACPGLSEAAIRLLCEQSWPGNVRQLENVVLRAAVMARGAEVSVAHVQSALAPRRNAENRESTAEDALRAMIAGGATLEQLVRSTVMCALRAEAGNVTAAARRLEVSKVTIYRKLEAWEKEEPGILERVRGLSNVA